MILWVKPKKPIEVLLFERRCQIETPVGSSVSSFGFFDYNPVATV